MLDDQVGVDGEVRRLTHAPVGEGVGAAARGLVQLQEGRAEDGRGRGAGLSRLVDDVHLVWGHRLDDVDAARDELGDLGRRLRYDPDAHVLEGGLGAPVIVVADQHVLLLLAPLDELVGPGADWILLHPVEALFLDHPIGVHDERGQPLDEERVGAVGAELDREVVEDLHAADLRVVAPTHELVLRVQHAVEARLDVSGGERAAVVEPDALPELDFPGHVVESLPRHGQARTDLARLDVASGQVIEDVVGEDERLA